MTVTLSSLAVDGEASGLASRGGGGETTVAAFALSDEMGGIEGPAALSPDMTKVMGSPFRAMSAHELAFRGPAGKPAII